VQLRGSSALTRGFDFLRVVPRRPAQQWYDQLLINLGLCFAYEFGAAGSCRPDLPQSALYCVRCRRPIPPDAIEKAPPYSKCPHGCGHDVAIHNKYCPEHRKLQKRKQRQVIGHKYCTRCKYDHPLPGCPYRLLSEGKVDKLTQDHKEWVLRQFLLNRKHGRDSAHYRILDSLEATEIESLEQELLRKDPKLPRIKPKFFFPGFTQGPQKDHIEPADMQRQMEFDWLVWGKPQHSELKEDEKLIRARESRAGQQRAKAEGKHIGRPPGAKDKKKRQPKTEA
jgi:hypothetical protein